MTYWKHVPDDLQSHLNQIAAVLDQGRDVRHGFGSLGDVEDKSHAAYEMAWARKNLGDEAIAMRLHVIVGLWGVLSAEMLAGIAALCQQGEMIYAPLPLARSISEHAIRIVWLLDNSPSVTVQRRFARVLLEDLRSAEGKCRATSHLAGKGSDAHRLARQELADAKARATGLFPGAKLNEPGKWEIEGEQLASPTQAAESFGKRWGEALHSKGMYDALSGYSHPSMFGIDFYDVVSEEVVLSTDRDTVNKFVINAVIPYYQALRHHMAYNGWESIEFTAWEKQLNVVFPNMIREPRQKPTS